MTWRRVPPVHSPIAPHSLVDALAAVVGLGRRATDDLENLISSTFEAPETILTNSGTSALVLALEATVPRGSVIALPGYACIDVIAAAIRAGVKVALYDIDPETLSPDLESVRKTLEGGARALVVASLYGYPPDMVALAELARAHGLPLVEDAAQGAGGVLHSKRIGAFGDVSVLSFGRGKGTTGGSGGALLVRQPALLEWARLARTRLLAGSRGAREGIVLAAQWILARPLLYSIPSSIPALKLGEMVYHPAGEPRALSAAAAAVLRSAFARDAHEVSARRANAAALIAASGTGRLTPARSLPGATPGYLRLAMIDADAIASAAPHLGALRGYPITLDEHPETRRILAHAQHALTGARTLRDRLLTLPTHSRVSAEDMARLAEWVRSDGDSGATPLRANEAA